MFKLTAFADDKKDATQRLKFGLEWVDNIVGKEEYAGYLNVFNTLFLQGLKSHDCVVKGLNISQTIPDLMTLGKSPFENNIEKGVNAGNQHFLYFTIFRMQSRTNPSILPSF